MSCGGNPSIARAEPSFNRKDRIMTNSTPRWTPPTDALRVRRLRHRFALSEPTARLLAGLCYGEGRA